MEWNWGFCGGSSYKSKSIIILSGLSQNASPVISIRGSGHRDQFAPLGCQLLCLAYAHHRHHTLIHIHTGILVYQSLIHYPGTWVMVPVWLDLRLTLGGHFALEAWCLLVSLTLVGRGPPASNEREPISSSSCLLPLLFLPHSSHISFSSPSPCKLPPSHIIHRPHPCPYPRFL